MSGVTAAIRLATAASCTSIRRDEANRTYRVSISRPGERPTGAWHVFFNVCAWGFAIGGVVLGYYAAWHYIPAARAALREGRASRARVEVEA